MWREYIKKIREVDPLSCPKCMYEMKIISFIYKKSVIRKILTHLDVYEEKENQRAPSVVAIEYTKPIEIVLYDDGWPGYDDPVYEF